MSQLQRSGCDETRTFVYYFVDTTDTHTYSHLDMVVATRSKRARKASSIIKEAASSDSEFDGAEDSYSDLEEEERPHKIANVLRKSRLSAPVNDEENDLFKALSSPVVAVSELALEWVESYILDAELSRVDAFTNLFNLLLRAVGCKILAQPHDMISLDSAAATVNELSIHFEKQKSHEYPIASTNKEIKHFHKNFRDFFGEVIFYAHETGCLYKESMDDDQSVLASEFMTSILAWFISLSTSKLRPFRYVGTVALLAIQTQLCQQAASLEVSLDRQQRQLSNAISNKKSKKRAIAHDQKVQTLRRNVEVTEFRQSTIEEYLDDITKGVFVHRFRDIDSAIRVECLRALGEWVMAYPSYFLKSTYLRYFGWLLSDPTDNVREEVVKFLCRLYKSLQGSLENMTSSFRKFTKRFQPQLINMIWKESVVSIKINLFAIYSELFKVGFLQEKDTAQICSYVFYLTELHLNQKPVSNKLKSEISKFITLVCIHGADSTYTMFFDSKCSKDGRSKADEERVRGFLKLKVLINFLMKSLEDHLAKRDTNSATDATIGSWQLVEAIFRDIFTLQNYVSKWEVIVQYLILDTSGVNFEELGVLKEEQNSFSRFLELSVDGQCFLVSFLLGCVRCFLNSKQKGFEASKVSPTFFLSKLTCHLRSIESILSKSHKIYPPFLQLWNELLLYRSVPIQMTFESSSSLDAYNQLHTNVLQYFLECQEVTDEIQKLYSQYFLLLLGSPADEHREGSSQNINPNIYLKVEDSCLALLTEIEEILSIKTSTYDAFNSDSEHDDPFTSDQKDLCNSLIELSNPIAKLNLIGDVVNIIKFVGEPVLDGPASVLEQLSVKLLSKINFDALVSMWPRNLSKVINSVRQAWKSLMDFALINLCWKLEDLMYALNDGTSDTINVEVYLDDICSIIRHLVATFVSLNGVIFGDKSLEKATKSLKMELSDFFFTFGSILIDLITSLRVFHDRTKLSNRFRGYDAMFSDDNKLGNFSSDHVPDVLEEALMNVFLTKETKLANLLDVTLERAENENVNFEEFAFELGDEEIVYPTQIETHFDSSDDDESIDDLKAAKEAAEVEALAEARAALKKRKLEQEIWNQEKDLSLYTMKLIGLLKSNAFTLRCSDRLKLNSDRLGQVFESIITLLTAPSSATEGRRTITQDMAQKQTTTQESIALVS